MRLGICVDGRGGTPTWRIEALGATAVSVPLLGDYDPSAYLGTFRARGWDVLLTLGPGILDDPSDWRASARGALERVDDLVAAGLATHVALGHEPDDGWLGEAMADDPLAAPRGGVGSWVLSAADTAELVHRARLTLGRRVPLLLGGLCSARPEWLSRIDLSGVDGVLVNPYADGDLMALLDGVVAEVAAQGLAERVALGIGELGRSDHDRRRGAIADWLGATLARLADRGDVSACFVAVDSDLTLDGYGQFDAEDRAKPGVAAVFGMAERLSGADVPLLGRPPDPMPPEPDEPDEPDEPAWPEALPLDVQELAAALDPEQCDEDPGMLANVGAHWPHAGPHLALLGRADDPSSAVALAASIWVGTDGGFEPRTEDGHWDRCERLYGPGSGAGRALGNTRHGDGHRFRARGFLPIRGRAAYERIGAVLGLDLLADPDLLAEPAIAMAAACVVFEANGLWAAARHGDYARIRRAVDPGLNGYAAFLAVVQRLWSALDASRPAPPADGAAAAYARARALARSGGRGAGELVARAYRPSGHGPLPTDPDALAGRTVPIGPDAAVPGDLVLYQYDDPSRGGARFAHVGLVTERPELVLDARVGLGVGLRPHVRGAVRRYRRVVITAAPTEEDEAMWKARYDEAMARVGELAAAIHAERAKLAATMPEAERPVESAIKAEHVAYGLAMERWRLHIVALHGERDVGLERIAGRLEGLASAPETRPGSADDEQREGEASDGASQ